MYQIPVNTGRPYSVLVRRGILQNTWQEIENIKSYQAVCIVTDDKVAPLYLDTVMGTIPSSVRVEHYAIPHGESSKNGENFFRLQEFFASCKLTRSDLIIALGGGVVGDLAGFAASCYLRGIDFVQIPTTLLAQVDSSVGGKTAVDLPQGKNLVGSFYQPVLVLCDPDTLTTLTPDIFQDGMAEVIKYACIWDASLAEKIQAADDPEVLEAVIARCIEIKAEVVAQDEFDNGMRMLLNFGHTIGHAVEQHYHYETYTHGQGVAIGMYTITRISEELGLTKPGTADTIRSLLEQYSLPLTDSISTRDIIELSLVDKKSRDGGIHLILLEEMGKAQARFYPRQDLEEFFLVRDRLSW